MARLGMKDIRDPQKLGEAYLELRKAGVPIDVAVTIPAPDYKSNEGPIEKYGDPRERPEG